MKSSDTFNCALVTGASSGIGRALCKLLAAHNVNLIIVARSEDKLRELAQELKGKVQVDILIADLADREQRKKIVAQIHEKAPDLVVNNAGWGYYGEALTYETEFSMNLLEVDVAALLEITLEAARTLVSASKEGVIMNISSAAAFQISPYFSAYAASKAFINMFSQSFDEEMKPYGIRVLTSCPGMVDTGFRTRASGGTDRAPDHLSMTVEFAAEDIWNQIRNRKPLRVFDWRYRVATFLTTYLVPKKLIAKVMRSRIEKLHKKTTILPISKR